MRTSIEGGNTWRTDHDPDARAPTLQMPALHANQIPPYCRAPICLDIERVRRQVARIYLCKADVSARRLRRVGIAGTARLPPRFSGYSQGSLA